MPKGRFCMGKCESGETSINDLSDMAGTPRCGIRTAQRAVPTLQQIQSAQIVAWLIKTATAEGSDELASVLQPFDVDLPFAPREKIVGKRKRPRIFVLKHRHGLIGVPLMLRRKHCGPDHIEKSVHLRFHFVAKLPDWVMQPGGEFDREPIPAAGHKGKRDLRRSWERVSRDAARAQLVPNCRLVLV